MNNKFLNHLQITLVVLDLALINFTFFFAEYLFRKGLVITSVIEYNYFLYFLNISWVLTTWVTGVYNSKTVLNFETFSRRSMNAFLYFTGFTMLYLFFLHQTVIIYSNTNITPDQISRWI